MLERLRIRPHRVLDYAEDAPHQDQRRHRVHHGYHILPGETRQRSRQGTVLRIPDLEQDGGGDEKPEEDYLNAEPRDDDVSCIRWLGVESMIGI